MDVEPTLPRGAINRRVEIELVCRPLARKAAQSAQRHLDIAGAQFLRVVEVSELAFLPHLDRALVLAFTAHPHPFGVVARGAEGAGPAGADPLVAAFVAFLLF